MNSFWWGPGYIHKGHDSSKLTSWLSAFTRVTCIPRTWRSGWSTICKSCREREVQTGRQGWRRGIYTGRGHFCSFILLTESLLHSLMSSLILSFHSPNKTIIYHKSSLKCFQGWKFYQFKGSVIWPLTSRILH